ncbi:MAG TPA: hybrid sensor histidine kinase/response regulator [Steroidobacteraceae bacterium]|nr:hybrid sensor histidine kinase/response regulator [Steroidobacteraceae bacterium]
MTRKANESARRRRRKQPAGASAAAQITRLRAKNRALKKSVRALMERVEKAVDDQGSAFSWFQAAATLEETIHQRTEQYERLNLRLKRELESRRGIELALKQAKELADRANATKTRFLAAASHDLRQPLSSALLFLESIDDAAITGLDRDYLRKSLVALASLSNLLGTLLDVARLDSGAIEPQYADFPVTAVLDRIVPEFEGVARSAGIGLTFVSSSAWVRSDMHLLETVLRNLISNAIRYTPHGRVLVGCRRRHGGLEIAVHDTGIGIENEHLEAIFAAYYQVPAGGGARTAGIGLGLSIVDRIARLLSLKRAVRSTPGRGSMFAVQVPYGRSRGRASLAARLPPVEAAAGASRRRRALAIAVIDDDAGLRLGLAATLAKWGHRPIVAATATEAVVQLIGADLTPDLVISDYHLAGDVKGDAAIEEVRREFDRVPPAVVMTSDPDPQLHATVRARGFTLLAKPLNLAKLRAMIEHIASR